MAELSITPTELARRLGHWFGTSPQFWLNLQAAYDIRLAEAAVGAEISRLPVRPLHEKRAGG